MKKEIAEALIKFAATPEGLEVLKKLSSVTGLNHTTDRDYDTTRAAVKALGAAETELKK